ncbi:MAG TPA: class I SAM-dependent methyltransferase [Candidatus Limnocylindrales bacterium]|nr:class I SAM-dependent methyltransferase [Candidatus Limnocylindrales bacterium]
MIQQNHYTTQIYWDEVLEEIRCSSPIEIWRAYMRRVYKRLLQDWLPIGNPGRGLKTDLFEEAVSDHHLLPDLGPGSVGLDHSSAIVQAARHRLLGKDGGSLFVVGDLRQIPLKSETVKYILAGSSLDHFPDKADIAKSLAELVRILAPGGILIITLDNPHNPIVWLRNHLPFTWLNRLHLVPYYVGATYNLIEARHQLEALGLIVTHVTAVSHVPRAPAIWLLTLLERLGWKVLEAPMERILDSFESLERWSIRYQTGYYLALRAEKQARLAEKRTFLLDEAMQSTSRSYAEEGVQT